MHHLAPQALEFMEKEVVMDTEKFLGKQVYPKELEGTEIGAYLLATFDGNSEDNWKISLNRHLKYYLKQEHLMY